MPKVEERRRAFTPLEVVIVVGVVCALFVLLVAAARAIRERAGETACQANLRSIARGIELYATNNSGYMPINYDGIKEATNTMWKGSRRAPNGLGLLYPNYVQEMKTLFCPAANVYRREGREGEGNWGTTEDVLSSYLFRGCLAKASQKIDENRTFAIVMDYCDAGGHVYNHYFGCPVNVMFGNGNVLVPGDRESSGLQFYGPSQAEFARIFETADRLRGR